MSEHQKPDSSSELLKPGEFLQLETDIKGKVIDSRNQERERAGGLMGRLLGSSPASLATHAVLILCLALILIVVLDNLHAYLTGRAINMELVNIIIPVISLAMGYIFGRGSR